MAEIIKFGEKVREKADAIEKAAQKEASANSEIMRERSKDLKRTADFADGDNNTSA